MRNMQGNPPRDQAPRLTVDWDVAEELDSAVDRAFAEKVLEAALEGRRPEGPIQVGLTVTTDQDIRALNRQYRDVDSSTDVLSFPLLEFERPEQPSSLFPLPPGEPVGLGDLVVSYPRVLEQAESYGHSPAREFAFLLVHGIMHLLGYDHEDPEDQTAMRREEEAVLLRLGLTR